MVYTIDPAGYPPSVANRALPSQFSARSSAVKECNEHEHYESTEAEENSAIRSLEVGLQPTLRAPENLYSTFSRDEVSLWRGDKLKFIKKLGEASRNQGQVHLMQNTEDDSLVAVKLMPNSWVCDSHQEFVRKNPQEAEQPWNDIGCTRFLNKIDFKYANYLHSVCRDAKMTYVSSSFASEGDLFDYVNSIPFPVGPMREAALAPVVVQLLSGLRDLHNINIVHLDVSLENILISRDNSTSEDRIRIIDFGMSRTARYMRQRKIGKECYLAPELQYEEENDAFLIDAFSAGVVLFSAFLIDYPWLSTKPGACKCFDAVRKLGFRKYCSKRKVRNTTMNVCQCVSEDLMSLVEGMLALDPEERLTLGERHWPKDRRSVWDEPWVKNALEMVGSDVYC